MTKDLLKTLEAMRPDTGADRLWPQHGLATERARIVATTSTPTAPAVRPRRVGAVALTAALFAVGAIGACAAATGLMPKAFTDHYYFWRDLPGPGETAVDPAAAERIASIPGPDGRVFSVFVARGAGSQRCLAAVFESAASAADAGPSEFTDLGGRCRQGPEGSGEFSFGDGAGVMVAEYGAGADGEELPTAFTYDAVAGAAVRAELRMSTGQVLPTVLADGSFYGWFPTPAAGSPRPVLTGYAPDGTVVGSIEI
ncbi:hypothetical protein ABI214_00275 [Prescottella soli]|uniref:Uncharacterized protein n=1 Tax=Prescottella soli TaxID=1543852 RepID=A0ABW9G127_9NOCA